MVRVMSKIKISEILLAPLSIIVLPLLAIWSLFVAAMVIYGPWGKKPKGSK